MNRKTIGFCRALLSGCAAILAIGAQAYSVAPLRLTIEPAGSAAAGRIEVRNTESRAVTLSAEPQSATIANDGTVTVVPGEDDLLVFPPQLVVGPGQTQVIQVRYVGEPALGSAKLYAVRIVQEPVDMQTGREAALKVGVNFVAAVLVQPKGAEAQVKVVGFRPQGKGLAIDVRNDGNGAARLVQLAWDVKGPQGATIAASGEAAPVGDSGYLMPGGQRTVILPLASDAAGVTAVTASLPAN